MKTASKYSLIEKGDLGFTLLEVMIAVSIIALIFLSLFRMQAGTIDLAAAGKFNTMAPILAKQLLVKIEQDISGWSEFEGDFGENYPGIKWTCEMSDSIFENQDFIGEDTTFKKIDIEIMDSSTSRSYKIHTWRLAYE